MLIRPRLKILVLVPITVVVIGIVVTIQPETPLDRAYRICKDCGLYEPEIDELINTMRHSTLTTAEQVQLWKDTAEPGAVELCRDCVDAVVMVARVRN